MAQAPIIPITPIDTGLYWLTERDSIAQASANAFFAGNFVTASGTGGTRTLNTISTATSFAAVEGIYGLAQKSALASTAEPYLTPTGTTATPISPEGDTEFWISTGTTAGAVGTGDAAALVYGSTYGMGTFTTAGYSGQQFVVADSAGGNNTGRVIFTGRIYDQGGTWASTDKNVPASFKVAPTVIQP